ncbi:MAG: hypothetical protein ABI237_14775 [Ginsengibacter sp.]
MRIFRKHNKEEIQVQPGKDRLAGSIAAWILKVQNGFAKFMNKRTERISVYGMKMMLIIFFLTGSGLSIYLIARTAFKKGPTKMIQVGRISSPLYYHKNDNSGIDRSLIITKQEYEEIQTFHRYMDSLHQSTGGKAIYDSILFDRPGLMDSIMIIEGLYQTIYEKNNKEESKQFNNQ